MQPESVIEPNNPNGTTENAVGTSDSSSNGTSASLQKVYSIDSLEVREAGSAEELQTIANPASISPRQYFLNFSTRRGIVVSSVITFLVLLLVAGSSLLINKNNREEDQARNVIPSQQIELQNRSNIMAPPEISGEQQSLLVNGDMITKGSIKVSSGGFITVLRTANLSADQAYLLPNASGTICLDTNNCGYATNEQFNQLQNQLGQIFIPSVPPSSLVNDQSGAVSIQGTSNQISVTTSDGLIKLATPQDLAPLSSPSFASLLLSGNLDLSGNLTLPFNCSTMANGGALTTNSSGRVICSNDDSSGGGGMVVDTTGGTAGTIPVFTDSQTIADSIISQALGTVTISGSLSVNNSVTFSALNNGFLNVNGSGVVSVSTIDLGADTSGNYVLGLAGGSGISISGIAGEGWVPNISIAVQANKGLEVDGNGLSLIDCAGAGDVLKYNTTTSQWACAADAGASGTGDDIYVNGTAATNANFANSAATATNPSITWSLTAANPDVIGLTLGAASNTTAGVVTTGAQDFAGNKTFTSNINIQGGSATLGTAAGAAGSLILHDNDGVGSQTVTITTPDVSASYVLTLPTAVGAANQCLKAQNGTGNLFWDDCEGGAGSSPGITSLNSQTGPSISINNATGAANVITIDDATTAAKGIASFNSSFFTTTAGAVSIANDSITDTQLAFNTGQHLTTTSSPTFSGLTTTTLTVNSEAFTDLTGNGLTISAGALTASVQANKGLEVDGNGLSLIDCAGAGDVLKYNTTTSQWACAADDNGSSTMTLQQAYNNSTSPEIVVDGTRGALTVRDNATPIGANLFELQNNTGSSTYFGVSASSTKVQMDSTIAFQVQNAAGANIFNVDTTNAKIGTVNTAAGSTNSQVLTIKSGDATGLTSNSGDVIIDSGTATGTAGNISIGTGAYAHNTTIGNTTGASALTLQGGTGGIKLLPSGTTNTGVVITPGVDSTAVLNVTDAAGVSQLKVDNTNGVGISLGNTTPAATLDVNGFVRIRNGSTGSVFTTPLGTAINAKLGLDVGSYGDFHQVLALGLASTSGANARGISVFDARAVAHQPSIGVFNLAETDILGLSWDGSDTTGYLKSSGANIGIKANTTNIATFLNNGNTSLAGDLEVVGADITTTATGTATIFNTNAVTLNIGGAATSVGGGINLAGGSGDTGCSINGDYGNLVCSGNVGGAGNISGANIEAGGTFTREYAFNGTVNLNDVVIYNGTTSAAEQTTTPRDTRVLGVVRVDDGASGTVAFAGSMTVNADTAAIAIGDQLVTSATAGRVTVDNNATTGIVGHAITAKVGGSNGTVNLIINVANGQYSPTFRNATDSTAAFQIQNAAGTSNLLVADTTNTRIGIGIAPAVALLAIGTNTTTEAGGIVFGVDANRANLYRSANNTLATDDIFNLNGITSATGGYIAQSGTRLIHTFGTDNFFAGTSAGNLSTSGSGANTGVGMNSLTALTTGTFNSGFGFNSLFNNTNGDYNAAFGGNALLNNLGGYSNTAVGVNVLRSNTSGDSNVAIGDSAGYTLTAANANTIGDKNTFIGYASGPGVVSASNLQNSVAIGAYSVVNQNDSLILGCINGTNGCTASTKVGIGTAAPSALLHINALAAGTDTLFKITDNTATAQDVLTIADGGATTFRNQTDSTAALRIQNAAATETLFTANNLTRTAGVAGNLLKVGNSTGTDTDLTVLQLDSTSANPTTNLASLNGGLFYNSNTHKVSIIENGAVKELCNKTDLLCGAAATTTLQAAYGDDVDGGDATISLTSADDSIVISNPASGGTDSTFTLKVEQLSTGAVEGARIESAGTANLLTVRDTTATAQDVFTLADGGAATFKNQTDSTAAFTVQKTGSGVELFQIDSSNSRVYIGDSTADSTGVILVLDTKNTSGDPTGVDGAMYYNSNMGRMRCYFDGGWRFCNDPVGLTWGFNMEEDFLTYDSSSVRYGAYNWQHNFAGTGSSTDFVEQDVNYRPGQILLTTGTTTTGYSTISSYLSSGAGGFNGEPILIGGGEEIEFAINIPTLADATNDYDLRLGLCDNTSNIDCTDGVYVEYDRGSSANWRYATASNDTRTKSSSSTAVTTGWHRFKIVVNPAGNSIEFFVDGVSMGAAITTNIPSTTGRGTQPAFIIEKEGTGTSSRTIRIDYFQYRNSLTTPR